MSYLYDISFFKRAALLDIKQHAMQFLCTLSTLDSIDKAKMNMFAEYTVFTKFLFRNIFSPPTVFTLYI